MRITLPDRPGALGGVATALATVGADIQWMEIISRIDGRVTDDFMIELPDGVMPDEAVSVCHAMDGVDVLWCSRYPAGSGLAMDLELLEAMLEHGDQALHRIVESAAEVFHVHWALLADTKGPVTLYASDMAPELDDTSWEQLAPFDRMHVVDLPAGWVPDWIETVAAVIPVAHDQVVVVGRHGGPTFESSELARLRYLASLGAMQSRRNGQ